MNKLFLVLFLFFLSMIVCGEKIVEFPDVMKPGRLKVSGDEIFIGEGHTVKIYSLKTFKLKAKFGKKGEGPGDFKNIMPDFLLYQDRILGIDGNKIAWFSREGKFIKEKRIGSGTGFQFFPLNGKFVRGESINNKKIVISIYDWEFKKIKTFYERLAPGRRVIAGPGVKEDAEWKMMRHYFGFDYNEEAKKIFVFDGSKGFYIAVFDENGSKLYTIEKKLEKDKVTGTFKKNALDELKLNKLIWPHIRKRTFTFFEYFPHFWSVKISDGKIYAATYKTGSDKTGFIILDLEGNILKEIFLPVKERRAGSDGLFHFDKGKFYHLVENEDTEIWELHIHEIETR